LSRLTTPFTEWDAYKLGIIDKDGNILKKKNERKTPAEKDAFMTYDLMILKLKKLLAKLPGGESKIASYAAALWLIREWNHFSNDSYLNESVSEEQLDESVEVFSETYFYYTTLIEDVNKKIRIDELFEEKFVLTELFDNSYPYKLKHGKDDFGGSKTTAKINLPDGSDLEIIFSLQDISKDKWELFFRRGDKISVTSQGDQYKIFSTVLSVADKSIKKYSPKIIFFTAEKDGDSASRMKLYDRMVSRFADDAGYNSTIKTVSSERQYTLTRKMNEDVPANSVGSGAIAGIGIGPQGEPGLTRTQQKKHRKRAAATQNPYRKSFADFIKDDLDIPDVKVSDTVVGEPGTGDTAVSGYRPKRKYTKHIRTAVAQ
jgi:hypothetical protein